MFSFTYPLQTPMYRNVTSEIPKIHPCCSPDYEQQDPSLLALQLDHFPSGTSSRVCQHLAQNILARRFQAFDFGVKENLVRYKQPIPPTIDLARVTPPHVLYVAQVLTLILPCYFLHFYSRIVTFSANHKTIPD